MTKLIGHKNILQQLSETVKCGRVGHAYIFEGVDGIGKTTAAFWFARNSMCVTNSGTPCGACENCIKAAAGTHPDIKYVDEAFIGNPKIKPGTVETMRIIKKDAYTTPFMAKRKFYIIPDGDELLPPAQNTLLKIFEEPPEYCTIIIICKNRNKLLQTITSRAVTVSFSPLSDGEMQEYFSENKIACTENLVRMCGGIPALAKTFAPDSETLAEFNKITAAFERYLKSEGDMTEILPLITKDNSDFALSCMEAAVSDTKHAADEFCAAYLNIFDILQNTRRRLRINCNFNLAVTDMLIKSWEAIHG